MRPKLTIGMAHFKDSNSVWFTIQGLRLMHDLSEVEIVLVNNSACDAENEGLGGLLELISGQVANVQYVPYSDVVGTSQSRNKIFEVATGTSTLCTDCHCLFEPGSINRLIEHYDKQLHRRDIGTLRGRICRQASKLHIGVDGSSLVNVGKLYLQAAQPLVTLLSTRVRIEYLEGRIGFRLQGLKRWLQSL